MNAIEATIPTKFHPLIEDQPAIFMAAKEATTYFESLYLSGPMAGAPTPLMLNWSLIPNSQGQDTVTVGFTEEYEGVRKGIGYEFPLTYLLDTTSSETMMLRLWRRVLIARSNAVGKRMYDALAELSLAEQDDAG